MPRKRSRGLISWESNVDAEFILTSLSRPNVSRVESSDSAEDKDMDISEMQS